MSESLGFVGSIVELVQQQLSGEPIEVQCPRCYGPPPNVLDKSVKVSGSSKISQQPESFDRTCLEAVRGVLGRSVVVFIGSESRNMRLVPQLTKLKLCCAWLRFCLISHAGNLTRGV